MGSLTFYTYMIGVCVGGICDWHQTNEKNTFTSISNCKVAAEISTYILNDRFMNVKDDTYRKLDYQCYNWYESRMKDFKAKYGYTESMGY